jgi:hypothetical protein
MVGPRPFAAFFRLSKTKRCDLLCERLKSEFNYAHVTPFPILERYPGRRVMYYMIHATDHPTAPSLMHPSYKKAVNYPPEPEEQLLLGLGVIDDSS